MTKRIGIGIIGTGFARKVQIPAFMECEGAFIASVASARAANAEATAKECGAGHFTDDWRETVMRDDVDLVCITTPPATHCEMTFAALDAGKHVLCEKPMAMSLAEAQAMALRARTSDRLALIDHELRFLRGRRTAFDLLRSGAIGKIRHAKGNFRAPHRGDPSLPWNWWSDETAGGGGLGAIASHTIDSFNWFLGATMTDVFCRLQTHVKKRRDADGAMRTVTSDDEANLIVKIADGDFTEDATGTISVSVMEYPKYQNRLEFFGTKGATRIDALGELYVGYAGEDDWTRVETDLGRNVPGAPDTGFSRGFVELAPIIVEAIAAGRTSIENAATFADGVEVQKILDAARESSRSGATVKV